MGVNWTREQQQVIDLRNRNILVSAAAGSGKTAVLVERIITRLISDQPPVDVDRLLIVTFTEAAAAEMKERIRLAIENALEAQPENEHLQMQETLIHNAQITTIHSFCLSVIRDHFHQINLDPGFRLAQEGELKLLKHEVLERVLEEKFSQKTESFSNFVESFATGRNDKVIEDMVLKIYEYSRSYPQPGKWFTMCKNAYELNGKMEDQPFVQVILSEVHRGVRDACHLAQAAAKICGEEDGPKAYLPMVQEDLVFMESFLEEKSFEKCYKRFQNLKWPTLSRKKQENVDPDKKEQVKNLRKQWKDVINGIAEQYFFEQPELMMKDMKACGENVGELFSVITAFASAFALEKSERNIIDFGDMERFALEILTEELDGELVPSKTAREYQEKYIEIMIDEYQDSNLIQEAILTSVSKESLGKNNIFMVGDVKQSIYRFRLSRPELFMEKYRTYSLTDSEKQRVDLHKNFRSRKEVLDSINYIFEQIMGEGFGGISYDEQAKLYLGASYEEMGDARTELLLVDSRKPDEIEAEQKLKSEDSQRELEARAVATKIKGLVETQCILDKKTGQYRKASYRDIALLTRSLKGWTNVFVRILKEEGIPTYATTQEGYFETVEVSTLLDYLRVLDNYRQDIPLAAVLTSPIVGLLGSQLGKIRVAHPTGAFYEAVWSYARTGQDEIAKVLQNMQQMLEHFRSMVPYMAIHDLIWMILEETGYGNYIAAMPAGEQRSANVSMLIERAAVYESTSYKGLFNFIRYIEQLKKYEIDMGEAGVGDETMDAVTMMSIHKSKGLEFPIVIVAGMGKQFNTQDQKGPVVLHGDFGIGVEAIDLQYRTKETTLLRKVIQKKTQLDNMSEELRVLYVAMTRAKEKLILVGTLPDASKVIEETREREHLLERTDKQLAYTTLTSARSYLDWLLPSILWENQEIIKTEVWTIYDIVGQEIQKERQSFYSREQLLHWESEGNVQDIPEEMEKQLSYHYEGEKQSMQMKFTVSELKKRAYLEEESGEILISDKETPLIPKFLQKEAKLSGASRGTAYHKFLELLDFSKEYEPSTIKQEIDTFRKQGRLSPEMATCIEVSDILTFLESDLAGRMRIATKAGKIYTEQPFVLGVEASQIYPEAKENDTVLVQGIIDAYFEEEGDLVVVDYKTDQVENLEELKEKYHAQLEYYGQALEQLTQKKIKSRMIYSFTLQQEIQI